MMTASIDFIGFPHGWHRPRTFALEVYKYVPDNFYQRNRIKEDDFSLDIIDLAFATAKTLCSYHLSERELYSDVLASMLSHLNFIDNTQQYLTLNESRYRRLRDFSKSTRIGEMAQGTNALFVAKQLNFPFIIDFDLAKDQLLTNLNIQTSGRTPDFVLINSTRDKIGLLESKGTMLGRVSGRNGYLSDAMEQIDAVVNPCFDAAIPCCTRFGHNHDHTGNGTETIQKSSINYTFLETECVDPKELNKLFKLHYASWFYLVGDFQRVNSLLESGTIEPIPDQGGGYTLDSETDEGNPIYWIDRPFSEIISAGDQNDYYLGIHLISRLSSNFKIGLYESVVKGLLDGGAELFSVPTGESNNQNIKRYPDGTVLFVKPN